MKMFSSSGKFSAGKPTNAKKSAPERSPKSVPAQPVRNSEAAFPERRPVRPNPMDVATPVETVRSNPVAAYQEAAPKLTPEQKAKIKKKKAVKRKNRQIILGAIAIFLAIMIAAFGFLAIRKSKAAKDFRKLINEVQKLEQAQSSMTSDDVYEPFTVPTEPGEGEAVPEATEPAAKTILPKYAPLYLENPEFYGWVKIPDTRINYPVMRSFESNDEYLYSNFKGKYSYCGIPFADINCSHDSDNLLIYGHNMKDGSMFAGLFKYEKESYFKKNPTIIFSDLYEEYEYEILSVFYDKVYLKTDDVFKFYQFIDAADEAAFDYAIDQLKEKSLYDTGVDAKYGDKLITLVTCSYQEDDGRFVVVARRK